MPLFNFEIDAWLGVLDPRTHDVRAKLILLTDSERVYALSDESLDSDVSRLPGEPVQLVGTISKCGRTRLHDARD